MHAPLLRSKQEEVIDEEFALLPDKTKANLKAIALRVSGLISPSFKCSDLWLKGFSHRYNWHWWTRHEVNAKRFTSVKKSMQPGETETSLFEKDILYSITDVLAKRALMSARGFSSLERWLGNDEMRYGPKHLIPPSNKSAVKIHPGQKPPQRNYVPTPVPPGLASCTILLSVSFAGTKLAPLIVWNSKKWSKETSLPTLGQMPHLHGQNLPDPLVVFGYSKKGWNTSEIHSKVYLNGVVLPHGRRLGLVNGSLDSEPTSPSSSRQSSVESPPLNAPQNPFATGTYSARSLLGELHDTFKGHTSKLTRSAYEKERVCTGVIAANATGFLQWNDKHLHKVIFTSVSIHRSCCSSILFIDALPCLLRESGHCSTLTFSIIGSRSVMKKVIPPI
jgi:hypothetical protein